MDWCAEVRRVLDEVMQYARINALVESPAASAGPRYEAGWGNDDFDADWLRELGLYVHVEVADEGPRLTPRAEVRVLALARGEDARAAWLAADEPIEGFLCVRRAGGEVAFEGDTAGERLAGVKACAADLLRGLVL